MKYLLLRARRLFVVFFAVTLLTFLLVNVLPGDVAYDLAGQDSSEEEVQAIREALGLDRPVLLRYFEWLGNFLIGDWGESYRTGEPVREAILSRFPVSFELMLVAQFFAVTVAVPAGIYSAYQAGRRADKAIAAFGFVGLSIPGFMAAILLFSLHLKILPATGYQPISEGLWRNLQSFILPGLAIATGEWIALMRVLRADMIGVLQEDYIALARAKGLPTWRIILFHALRPSCFSMITVLGLNIGALIGGSVLIETIFALPGVGRLLISAIYARDFIVIQGVVTFIAIAYVLVNFAVDLLYAALDPRIRTERVHG